MDRIEGAIRAYAWGSRTALASLQGRRVPTDGPEAELWLGAHPDNPATVLVDERVDPAGSLVDRRNLDSLIADNPVGILGADVVARFGPRLPFLLKVLAAAAPLSLQAHPHRDRARAQYDAGYPGYRDPNHKPELLVALEGGFDALCGFRDPAVSARVLAKVPVPGLDRVVSQLADGDLRAAVSTLLDWPDAARAALVTAAASRDPFAAALAARYPADAGVVVALLLNRVHLAPGEAIWMPAGNLHAYLRGTGVEIMAASDNVLRGGLTPKPVDVPELLRVLDFEVLADPVVRPVALAPGVCAWPVPVEDFALLRAEVTGEPVWVPAPGPRIALCLSGQVEVHDGSGSVTLTQGQAAFGAASEKPLSVHGEGELYVATTGV